MDIVLVVLALLAVALVLALTVVAAVAIVRHWSHCGSRLGRYACCLRRGHRGLHHGARRHLNGSSGCTWDDEAAERDFRERLTRQHRGALSKRLRAGAPLLCESRSDSGSCCDRPHGHTGLHGCVEIMRDKGHTWPCSVYWADRPFRVEAQSRPPRALDPVTVTDGRVERIRGGAA